MNRIMITLCLGVSLAACSKSAEEAPAKAPIETTAASKPAAAVAPVEDATEIPVAADFEEEVRAEITAENYAAELDKLETELPD